VEETTPEDATDADEGANSATHSAREGGYSSQCLPRLSGARESELFGRVSHAVDGISFLPNRCYNTPKALFEAVAVPD